MKRTAARFRVFFLLLAAVVAGAEEGFPEFKSDGLKLGRATWLGTCKNCRATGFADARRSQTAPVGQHASSSHANNATNTP